jgi:drug/metabolite transporter (DMT)-like permease
MPAAQNLKNHARFDPIFHFFLVPLSLANVILAISYTIHQWPAHSRSHLWWIVMSLVLLVFVFLMRIYSLKNQDRLIRLEERLRFAALLSSADAARAQALTVPQIVALRFASDDELPKLVHRTLAENLTPKQIKHSIEVWRPDYTRI